MGEEIVKSSSNSVSVRRSHFHTNTLGKGMKEKSVKRVRIPGVFDAFTFTQIYPWTTVNSKPACSPAEAYIIQPLKLLWTPHLTITQGYRLLFSQRLNKKKMDYFIM